MDSRILLLEKRIKLIERLLDQHDQVIQELLGEEAQGGDVSDDSEPEDLNYHSE
jgi:hypothetical protein